MIPQQRVLSLAMDYGSSEKKKELDKLKQSLAATELCNDKATAAAFGYLLAQREMEEQEREEFLPSIGDQVYCTVEDASNGETTIEEAVELIFGLIYLWLKEKLNEDGYCDDDHTIVYVQSLFAPFVKPSVIRESKPS
jgi:hypothetical protein